MNQIRVVIADDHTLFRQGVRQLIGAEPDIEVAGEAANGGEAVERAAELQPDVVLMDVGMPGLSCFDATRQIRRAHPETRILILTMYDDEDYLLEGLEVGASGYVLKDSPARELTDAIREVARGGSHLSPRMLSRVVNDYRNHVQTNVPMRRSSGLTIREREVLKLLAEGNSVKEIAAMFDLSVKTVEAHKFNLMRKLDIHNKAQLVQYAIQKRIITLPARP